MPSTDSPASEAPARSASFLGCLGVLLAVGVLSSVAALTIAANQARPLGDRPEVLLRVGGWAAVALGAFRVRWPRVLGTRSWSPRFLLLSAATMIGFPVWSVIDMTKGGDHGLLPIEFMFYGMYAIQATVIAVVVSQAIEWIGRFRSRAKQGS